MTDEKEVPDTPIQSDEARQAVINRSSAGNLTAVGVERARQQAEADGEDPAPTGDDRGSKIPIAGGEPQPDYPPHEAPQAVGAQAEPAAFTTNGTLPVNHVASPTGLVPVSAVTTDQKQATKLVQDNLDRHEKEMLRSGYEKLSRAKIESMSAGDLRAVASDRGYDIGEYAGHRATRMRFIAAQQQDEGLTASEAAGSAGAETSGSGAETSAS